MLKTETDHPVIQWDGKIATIKMLCNEHEFYLYLRIYSDGRASMMLLFYQLVPSFGYTFNTNYDQIWKESKNPHYLADMIYATPVLH